MTTATAIRCGNLECRKEFQPSKSMQWYCNLQCQWDARAVRRLKIIEEATSVVNPLAQRFEGACLACGRTQADYMLTEAQAREMKPLARCGVCGGRCLLERVLLTTTGVRR